MLPLRLLLLSLLIATSTVLHVLPLLLVALVKVLLPFGPVQRLCNPLLTGMAESWIGFNNWLWDRFTHTRVDLREDAALRIPGGAQQAHGGFDRRAGEFADEVDALGEVPVRELHG